MTIKINVPKEYKMQLITSGWKLIQWSPYTIFSIFCFMLSVTKDFSKEQNLDKMKNKKQEKHIREISCGYNSLQKTFMSVMTAKLLLKFN